MYNRIIPIDVSSVCHARFIVVDAPDGVDSRREYYAKLYRGVMQSRSTYGSVGSAASYFADEVHRAVC
jgi:hypothetical protein